MARVPAYFDAFLAAIAGGAVLDHVHLGHWDHPDAVGPARARASFAQAQASLSARLVAMLEIAPGHRVLDVGCGFGGTLRAIRRDHPEAAVFGLNVDPRQLAVGLRRDGATNAAWIAGDAGRLPFAEAAFDRLVCVEAAFHFPSRRTFFEEAHRVLRREGLMVMSDIVLTPPPLPPETIAHWVETLKAEYGPWPAPWQAVEAIARDAAEAGFAWTITDATAHTWPSYHTIAPEGRDGLSGGGILRELHRLGCLRYLYIRLDRR